MAREMTEEERHALLEFQTIYGDRWRTVMEDMHLGIVKDSRANHISHLIRRIRNYVTPNPNLLPDLRDVMAPKRKGTHHA